MSPHQTDLCDTNADTLIPPTGKPQEPRSQRDADRPLGVGRSRSGPTPNGQKLTLVRLKLGYLIGASGKAYARAPSLTT